MIQKSKLSQLLLATSNRNKIKEFKEFFKDYPLNLLTLENSSIIDPEETGEDFAANALLKAKYYQGHTNEICLADDSGLCIEALDNFPGIYSARVAGPSLDFAMACTIIAEKLLAKNLLSSRAKFVCSLAVALPNNQYEIFHGEIAGQVTILNLKYQGFGYEPIFIPDGYSKTFSEMAIAEKNLISHRAKAFRLFANKYL